MTPQEGDVNRLKKCLTTLPVQRACVRHAGPVRAAQGVQRVAVGVQASQNPKIGQSYRAAGHPLHPWVDKAVSLSVARDRQCRTDAMTSPDQAVVCPPPGRSLRVSFSEQMTHAYCGIVPWLTPNETDRP